RSRAPLRAVDGLVGDLAGHARRAGAQVLVVSEYGIRHVRKAVDINRALRRAGLLAVQDTVVGELLDAGASRAFAVTDHQVAHVYVRNPDDVGLARAELERLDGVADVLDAKGKEAVGLDHPRAGELLVRPPARSWSAPPTRSGRQSRPK